MSVDGTGAAPSGVVGPRALGIASLALAVLVPVAYAFRVIPYTENLLISFALLTCWGQFLIAGIAFLLQARDNARNTGLGWRHHLWAFPAAVISIPVSVALTFQFLAMTHSFGA